MVDSEQAESIMWSKSLRMLRFLRLMRMLRWVKLRRINEIFQEGGCSRAGRLWVKTNGNYQFWVGAPPILVPILVGIGMFTGVRGFDPWPSESGRFPRKTGGRNWGLKIASFFSTIVLFFKASCFSWVFMVSWKKGSWERRGKLPLELN